MTEAKRLPKTANLGGTRYRVQKHEGLIVFASEPGVWGTCTRIAFRRVAGCWYVTIEDSDGKAMVSHITRAYEIVCGVYGGNFEQRNGEHDL